MKITIRECVTEDGIFSGDWTGVNLAASADKYIDRLDAAVRAAYPTADVSVEGVTEPSLSPLVVVGDGYYQEEWAMRILEEIIAKVFQDFASWVVEV